MPNGICPNCKIADRHVGPTGKKFPYCQKCHNKTTRAWRDNNLEASQAIMKKSHLKTRFGITPDEEADLFVAQNGRCATCRTADAKGRHRNGWEVDHNPVTLEVRGIVCDPCNQVLKYHEKFGIPVAKEFLDYLQNPPARSVLKREQKVLLFAGKRTE